MARRRRSGGWTGAARASAAELRLLVAAMVAFVLLVAAVASWRGPVDGHTGQEPLTMAQARASNAAVPVDRRWRIRARPYRFRGGPAAREQAVDCLATAALYEVGDDPNVQKAVIQVILNRAQAAGFPRTICGVVYEGYARQSGCQFSFTCDGSFRRRPQHDGWAQARAAARRALAGTVFAEVGRATHYHADWAVPYWRDSLTKVAQVGPHLFYVRVNASARRSMERVKGIEPSS